MYVDLRTGIGVLAIACQSLLVLCSFPDLNFVEEAVLIARFRAKGIRQRLLSERADVVAASTRT